MLAVRERHINYIKINQLNTVFYSSLLKIVIKLFGVQLINLTNIVGILTHLTLRTICIAIVGRTIANNGNTNIQCV